MTEEYININKIAEIKGLTSNRSLRLAIQKGKYIAREVKVFGGTSYEILYSSLEPEVQEKLQDELIKEATQSNCTALVPLDTKPKYPTFIAESAKLTALARVDVVKALQNIRSKYKTKKEADSVFLDLYNSGMLLPKVYKFLGSISVGCCVVASDTAPVKEVIQDSFNGILTDFYNIDLLAQKINSVLEEPEKYSNIRVSARKTIKEKYELQKLLKEQIDFLNSCKIRA